MFGIDLRKVLLRIVIKKLTGGGKVIKKIQEFLKGKKTYLSAIAGVVAALIKFSGDGDVGTLIIVVMAALGFSGNHAQNERNKQ